MRFVRQQINFLNCREINFRTFFFAKYSHYTITDIIIIFITFVWHYIIDYSWSLWRGRKEDAGNKKETLTEELVKMNILMYYRFVNVSYFVNTNRSWVHLEETTFHFLKSRIPFPSTFSLTSVLTSLFFFLCIILSQLLTLGFFFQSRRRSFISCI